MIANCFPSADQAKERNSPMVFPASSVANLVLSGFVRKTSKPCARANGPLQISPRRTFSANEACGVGVVPAEGWAGTSERIALLSTNIAQMAAIAHPTGTIVFVDQLCVG